MHPPDMAPPDVGPPEEMRQMYGQAVRLLDEMRHLQRTWQHMNPPGPIKRGDIFLLGAVEQMALHGEKPVTVGNLAAHMRQSAPGISQRVSALEDEGYLRRETDKKDRRVSYIYLTKQGEALSRGVLREFFRRMNEALETLGPKKTQALLELMRELSEAFGAVKVQKDQEYPAVAGKPPKEDEPLA